MAKQKLPRLAEEILLTRQRGRVNWAARRASYRQALREARKILDKNGRG